MSTHTIPIIEVKEIIPHPNADQLEIIIIAGWQTCVRKGQFKIGDKACWIQPDFECPLNRSEFEFLRTGPNQKFKRIKVAKLRGEISQGLLINVPQEFENEPVGTNLMDQLGIRRWEPDFESLPHGTNINGPPLFWPKYDVENFNNYKDVAIQVLVGQEVIITEKVNGMNASYVYCSKTEKFYMKSRTYYKIDDGANYWSRIAQENPAIEAWCREHPDHILYGEIFGEVKGMRYNSTDNKLFFAVFDIMKDGKWLNAKDMMALLPQTIPLAPVKAIMIFDEGKIRAMAEEMSVWPGANHISEGVVFRPTKEIIIPFFGRAKWKIVSNRYFMGEHRN